MQLEDVTDFVGAVLLCRVRGGNVATVMAVIAEIIQDKIAIRQQILSLIALLAALLVLLLLWPGPKPGSPTPLTRLYARLGAIPRAERAVSDKAPWVRRMPVRPLVSLLRPVMSERYQAQVQRLLRIARLERSHTYEDILAMKLSYVLIGWFYLGLLLLKRPDPLLGGFLGVVVVPAFLYPDIWLKGRAQRRQEQIRRELPAFLSALAVALEAGLHLLGAVGEVVRERPGPLAEDLRAAVELEISELTVVMAGLLQAFTKGSGHVVRTVRDQAAEAWQVRRRRAESLAQTASVKLFMPIALLALPGFLIFLLGPAVLEVVAYFIK